MCGQQQLRHFASFIGLIEYVCRNTKRRRKWLADNRHCTSRVINAKRRKQWKRRKPEQRHLPCKLDSGQPWSVLWKLHSLAGHAANVACCSSHVARRTVPVVSCVWTLVSGFCFPAGHVWKMATVSAPTRPRQLHYSETETVLQEQKPLAMGAPMSQKGVARWAAVGDP